MAARETSTPYHAPPRTISFYSSIEEDAGDFADPHDARVKERATAAAAAAAARRHAAIGEDAAATDVCKGRSNARVDCLRVRPICFCRSKRLGCVRRCGRSDNGRGKFGRDVGGVRKRACRLSCRVVAIRNAALSDRNLRDKARN